MRRISTTNGRPTDTLTPTLKDGNLLPKGEIRGCVGWTGDWARLRQKTSDPKEGYRNPTLRRVGWGERESHWCGDRREGERGGWGELKSLVLKR